ncbi:MAG: hypothetical protein EPO02_03585 [Nitrospirae bacterium]|nr:MAG: hypothetical protein EPO02_03585 [Nitrospirota bacterium]
MSAGALKAPPGLGVLACLLLFGFGELSGALQGGYRQEIHQYAIARAQAHPAAHQLTGVEDIDQVILERVADRSLARVHTFHLHSHGLGLVTIILLTVLANTGFSPRTRAALSLWVSLGLLYPFGWLTLAWTLPSLGEAAAFQLAERLFFIPFGGAYLLAVGALIVLYATDLIKQRREGTPP